METSSKIWSLRYFVSPFLTVFFFSAIYFQPTINVFHDIITPNYTVGNFINSAPQETYTYLVDTTKCKIPNLDPWNADAKPFFRREKYISCRTHDLLTYIEKNFTHAVLKINHKIAKKYTNLKCCYKNVTRTVLWNQWDVPDDRIAISLCVDFKDKLTITDRTVMVKCHAKTHVYSNVHVAVTSNKRIAKKIEKHSNTTKPLSLLIIGIDSISRLNLIRTMPKTYSYLNKTGWIEYAGYNKIGDNTFPNIIAALTGKAESYAHKVCNPKEVGKLEKCDFIWKSYSELGYITAYAEDEARLNTFNYKKKGFVKQPTDFYFRAYTYATHQLARVLVDGMNYCTGPEMSGERILNLAKDFSTTFLDHPTFGMFWMNSFSHNLPNSPTRLDKKVLNFFKDLVNGNVLNNTMVIFISDHGLRFGKVRQTKSGWLEERLPFLHFWLPSWFRKNHPDEYNNLKDNAFQLTTPYDLYMTIQDIMVLSNLNYTSKPSAGCPICHSLFKKIDEPRSCDDVGIDPHWCTCTGYQPISANYKLVQDAVRFILDDIERTKTKLNKERADCVRLKLGKIISSDISTNTNTYRDDTYLLIIIKTVPEAVFEATIKVKDGEFRNAGPISRLNSHVIDSFCAKDSQLKLYCYCKRSKFYKL